jgi:hypothetical protein
MHCLAWMLWSLRMRVKPDPKREQFCGRAKSIGLSGQWRGSIKLCSWSNSLELRWTVCVCVCVVCACVRRH